MCNISSQSFLLQYIVSYISLYSNNYALKSEITFIENHCAFLTNYVFFVVRENSCIFYSRSNFTNEFKKNDITLNILHSKFLSTNVQSTGC